MLQPTSSYLKKIGLFSSLSEEDIATILSHAETKTFAAGAYIFREGDDGDAMYVVLSGDLEVLKVQPATHIEKRLAERGEGDFFGEMSLLDNQPRSASLRAKTEARLLEIKKSEFDRILHQHTNIGIEIIRIISLRLRASDRQVIGELERRNAKQASQIEELRQELSTRYAFDNIITTSEAMMRVLLNVSSVAVTNSNVLIMGESGTGKEVIARAVHYNSPRSPKKFVAVDCGSLSETLLESELFGHKKGAFTGATEDKLGLFEEANGGTIFLDEITNTSLSLQARLLRVLQEKEIRRIGETTPRKIDVRIIAATNRNLKEEVSQKRFREDLYYRLNVFTLDLPPLRDRLGDAVLLGEFFLKKICLENKKPAKTFSPDAVRLLETYPFPGNIRELQNTIERAVILSKSDEIQLEDFPPEMVAGLVLEKPMPYFDDQVRAFKRSLVRKVLEECGGNKTKAAAKLGMHRTYFFQVLKQLDLPLDMKIGE